MLFEVFTRQEPYADMEATHVLYMVSKPLSPGEEPFRPSIPKKMPGVLQGLMRSCWAQDPAARPSFEQLQPLLQKLDTRVLQEWIGDIAGFKGKTAQQLVYDVFPPHIAETLKMGLKVEPEHHDCVTIFFSDIVGFTDISRQLQPVQVMDMLDRLYEGFDKLARERDVFKVETIGDAYMAVANLIKPEPKHAQNIAEFAMAAIEAARNTPVKIDQPELGTVNIRVGFHTGPVVSSVVGNLNPRFCLFGDTVNTASRMESNSEKGKIHASESAAEELQKHAPHIKLISRGEIPIKGKGTMTTYWVLNELDASVVPIPCSKSDAVADDVVNEFEGSYLGDSSFKSPIKEVITLEDINVDAHAI
ncbi:hypothetical protein CYMTET_8813 [Cymbomonas tetramitiformis]|uniref:Guanylate cyclase domain-containing protein n=1 Tax=Cymbomonas tetramitiformis TaxID=36881 RepID=A0AAE0LFM3_9CHLO|nr:hypothetical protein CYMTET_8813 [Cymbomonas tetramitiformis]